MNIVKFRGASTPGDINHIHTYTHTSTTTFSSGVGRSMGGASLLWTELRRLCLFFNATYLAVKL